MDTQKKVYKIIGIKGWMLAVLLVFAMGTVGSSAAFGAAAPPGTIYRTNSAQPGAQVRKLSKEVRKRLVTIPWYNVFDNLDYRIRGKTVILGGQVVFPLSRKSVGRYVKGLPGVEHVVNHVKNLPVSPFNRQVRMEEFQALFMHQSPLFHYVLGVNPRIHIVVNNGRVTLYGVVENQADRQFAGMRARSVPDVFSVKNKLRVV